VSQIDIVEGICQKAAGMQETFSQPVDRTFTDGLATSGEQDVLGVCLVDVQLVDMVLFTVSCTY
jgi:hypothetical protein